MWLAFFFVGSYGLAGMKTVATKGKPKFVVIKGARPKMTRKLAEARSVGDSSAPKFDGVSFLKSA